jgi:hypothetical protein
MAKMQDRIIINSRFTGHLCMTNVQNVKREILPVGGKTNVLI